MNRTAFLIDGFNLYHSLKKASKDLKGATTKWLDIHSLCTSYLHIIGNNAQITNIYYFSALATHLQKTDPGKITRHRTLLECLKSTGIIIELSHFKETSVWCPNCLKYIPRHEEKETDVAISAKLLEVCITNECDTIVLVTGDTDVAPAVKTVRRLYPNKTICFAFPYARKNRELIKIAHKFFTIHHLTYTHHLFPDPVVLPDGRQIRKPIEW